MAVLLDHDCRSIAARSWQYVRPFCSPETCTVAARQPTVHGTAAYRAGTEARAGVGKPLHGMGRMTQNKPSAPLGTRSVRAPGLFGGMAVLVDHDGRSARSQWSFLSINMVILVDHDGHSARSRQPFWSITTVVRVDHYGRSGRSRRPFGSITTVIPLDHDGRFARSGRPFHSITTAVLLDHDGRSVRSRRPFRSITTAILVDHYSRSARSRWPFDCCSIMAARTVVSHDRNIYDSGTAPGCTWNSSTVSRD